MTYLALTVAAALLPQPIHIQVAQLAEVPQHQVTLAYYFKDDGYWFQFDNPMARANLKQLHSEVVKKPGDPFAWYALSVALGRNEDTELNHEAYKRTAKLLNDIILKNPQDDKMVAFLAQVHHDMGDRPAAESAIRKALRLAPEEASYWQLLWRIMLELDPIGAEVAFENAIKFSPKDHYMLRFTRSIMQLNTIQSQPESADKKKQLLSCLRETDELLVDYSAWLKKESGACNAETRDRCLIALFTRDAMRQYLRMAEEDDTELPFAFDADTIALLPKVIPVSTDDPVRLFFAIICQAVSKPWQKETNSLHPKSKAACLPYLKQLEILSEDKDQARASMAAFVHGFLLATMFQDEKAAMSKFEQSVTLTPDFDFAWRGLLRDASKFKKPEEVVVLAQHWVNSTSTPGAWIALARAYEALGDKQNVERTIQEGLKKHPKDTYLLLAQVNCELGWTNGWTKENTHQIGMRLFETSKVIQHAKNKPLTIIYNRTAALYLARTADERGQGMADAYINNNDEAEDAKKVRALFESVVAKTK